MHNIGMERRRYRQRNMEDITESVLNKADKVHPGLYRLGMQVGENYSKKKTLGLGRFGQDIIFDNTRREFRIRRPEAAPQGFRIGSHGEGGRQQGNERFQVRSRLFRERERHAEIPDRRRPDRGGRRRRERKARDELRRRETGSARCRATRTRCGRA